jgi:GntR family transcriptional regulator
VHDAPEIDHRGQIPPCQQIAAWLRSRIESGELAPGAVLSSEKELIGAFGVGRTTVRRTMALLR